MAKNLVQLRKERGNMTQKQLSEKLGIAPSTLAMYEIGQRTPALEKAKQIANYFELKVEDIIFGPKSHGSRTKTNAERPTGTAGQEGR